MKNGVWIISLFLVLLTWICFGQVQQALAMLFFYALGALLTCVITGSKNNTVYFLYTLFFLIYGLLCIVTQFQLIHDPYTDYYLHNDACDAFFPQVMSVLDSSKGGTLFENTILNPFFADYSLPMYIFAVIAKAGVSAGIDNIRFLLRIHEFMMAAIVVALIADTMVSHQKRKDVIKRTFIFGLCSYLFVGSCIFTRDMHVCFVYSCILYYMLKPNVNYIVPKFIILFILALGCRPENGIFSVVFFGAYFFYNKKGGFSPILLILALLVMFVYLYYIGDTFNEAIDTVNRYQKGTVDANRGGVFEMVHSLPFPINILGLSTYGVLMPIPFDLWLVGQGNSFYTIPYVLSPFLLVLVFISVLWYLLNNYKVDRRFSLTLLVAIISFMAINSTSPDVRRSFASIPGLYMGYCLFADNVPKGLKRAVKYIMWPLVLVTNLFFFFYTK